MSLVWMSRRERPSRTQSGVLLVLGLLLPVISGSAANLDQISRVSLATGGTQANNANSLATISGNGNFVTFSSTATNLVAGDTNAQEDVFVHDRGAATTERVSIGPNGEGNDRSHRSMMSQDGRYVVFSSLSTNLVANDTNGYQDIFVRDRTLGQTVRVSVSSAGAEANSFSGQSTISADGRFVTFFSFSTNLVPVDTNNIGDVFLHDRDTDVDGTFDEAGAISTVLVSVASDETQANDQSLDSTISPDGSTVVFESRANNLVAGDTNGFQDVFVRNLAAGTTERVSIATNGAQGNSVSYQPRISGDGNLIVFSSPSTTFVAGSSASNHIYLRNRAQGTLERLSNSADGTQGNNVSFRPCINAQGTLVAFDSIASNLVTGDTNGDCDVFVRVLGTSEIHQVRGADVPNGWSAAPWLSADGGLLSCESMASNLVAGDTNAVSDIFVAATTGGGGGGDPDAPVANAGADQMVALPHDRRVGGMARVTVNGSGSTDPNGQRLSYLWTSITTERTGRAVTFKDNLPAGVHTITLRVTDPDGKFDEDSVQITVNDKTNAAPTANAGPDKVLTLRRGTTTLTLPLAGRGTDPDRDPLQYEWRDISMGLPGTVLSTRSAVRLRLAAGNYTLRLTVTDPFGLSGFDDVAIQVNAPPP